MVNYKLVYTKQAGKDAKKLSNSGRPLNITCQFKIWYGNPIISKLKFKDFKKLYPLITFLYNYTNSTY